MNRDTARAYAQGRFAPRIVRAVRHEHSFPGIGELELLGPVVPEHYGDVGASYGACGLVAHDVRALITRRAITGPAAF